MGSLKFDPNDGGRAGDEIEEGGFRLHSVRLGIQFVLEAAAGAA
jgi:hypothetical protein